MTSVPAPIQLALRKIMRPLASMLLRNGVAFADFAAIARSVFVEIADEEFSLPGRKQSVSRVSLLTGINRKDVKRLLEADKHLQPVRKSHNRAARVISAWLRDSAFQDTDNQPAVLAWGGDSTVQSFENLVKQHSGDIPPRAVLDELLRIGAARMEQDDSAVRLLASGYVPNTSTKEMLRLTGESVGDLLGTINHNLRPDTTSSRLQLRVDYDDLPDLAVERFRKLSTEKSRELLLLMDRYLASQDRSLNCDVKGEGRYRAGLGIYYFEQKLDNQEGDDDHQ